VLVVKASSQSNIRAIVGGSVGGTLAFIAMLIAAIVFVKTRQKQKLLADQERQRMIQPFSQPGSYGRSPASVTTGDNSFGDTTNFHDDTFYGKQQPIQSVHSQPDHLTPQPLRVDIPHRPAQRIVIHEDGGSVNVENDEMDPSEAPPLYPSSRRKDKNKSTVPLISNLNPRYASGKI
jgi:hypothetical protein